MKTEQIEECGTCKFYVPKASVEKEGTPDRIGECYANPPKNSTQGRRPEVIDYEFCRWYDPRNANTCLKCRRRFPMDGGEWSYECPSCAEQREALERQRVANDEVMARMKEDAR